MRTKNMAFILSASLLLPLGCLAMEDFEITEGMTDYLGTPTRSVTVKYNGSNTYEGICGTDRENGGTMSLIAKPRENLLIISDDEEHVITYYSSPSSVKWTEEYEIFEYKTTK